MPTWAPRSRSSSSGAAARPTRSLRGWRSISTARSTGRASSACPTIASVPSSPRRSRRSATATAALTCRPPRRPSPPSSRDGCANIPSSGCGCTGVGGSGCVSNEHGDQDAGDDQADDRVLEGVVGVLVPRLHALAGEPQVIDVAEDLVEHADPLAGLVLGGAFLDDAAADPAIDRGHGTVAQRPLDVAEQDDAGLVGGVLGVVAEGLVEQQIVAVAPGIGNAVHQDAALP